jgi:hypothetical protein
MPFSRWAVWTCLAVLPLTANDTLATLGAGGLIPVKSSTISILREDLEISVEQIRVRYLFHNYGAKPVDAVVAFPLPVLEGGLVEHVPLKLPSPDRDNFVDFKVFLNNNQAVPVKVEARAYHEGREITADLRAARLPVSVIDRDFQAAVKKLEPEKLAAFRKAELLVTDSVNESESDPDRRYWPNWETRVQFYWSQHFPAGGTVEIRHSYRPVVGGSMITLSDDGTERVKPYCGGADAVKQIRDYKLAHPNLNPDEAVFLERQIQYILTTANNWHGSIREFHLSVNTLGTQDLLLTCMPGLRRIGQRHYELVRRDFHPEAELELSILQPNQ